MRIAIAVTGTRGDVQPAMILAHALTERGHSVRTGVPPNMIDQYSAAPADGAGELDLRPLGLDTRAHLAAVAAARVSAGRNPLRRLRVLAGMRHAGWDQLVDDLTDLAVDTELIVTGVIAEQAALVVAEAHGVPLVSLHHAPVRRNARVGPLPGRLPGTSRRAVLAQWAALDTVLWLLTLGRENRLRTRLGLPGVRRSPTSRLRTAPGIEIQAYDPLFAVVDDPTWTTDSRRRGRPVTGFIGLPTRVAARISGTPSATGVDDWIDAGDPPVYVGFGSMPLRAQQPVVDAILSVAGRLGRRVLVCAGWTDLRAAAATPAVRAAVDAGTVRVAEHVDHDAVFGRCAVIVHHGGAGTTAAAMRAGTPSVICWYGADQPFWGAAVERLEIGAALPMPRAGRGLDPERLHDALGTALDPATGDRARRLAARLVDHDAAVAAAVLAIEQTRAAHETAVPTDPFVEVDR